MRRTWGLSKFLLSTRFLYHPVSNPPVAIRRPPVASASDPTSDHLDSSPTNPYPCWCAAWTCTRSDRRSTTTVPANSATCRPSAASRCPWQRHSDTTGTTPRRRYPLQKECSHRRLDEPPAADGVRKKSKLLPLSARHLHQMKLRRLREPCRNQHLSLRGMPIREAGASIRPVSPRRLRQRRRYLRHAIYYQIVCWRNDRLLRRRSRSHEQHRCQDQKQFLAHHYPSPTNSPPLLTPQTIGHASRTASVVSPPRMLKSRCIANQPCSGKS